MIQDEPAQNPGKMAGFNPDEIDRVTQNALLGITSWMTSHRAEIEFCTKTGQQSVLVRAALTYLASVGQITINQPSDEWTLLEVTDSHAVGYLDNALAEQVTARQRVNAALTRGGR